MKAGGESWSSGPIEAGADALFTPDLITPSQYFDQRRTPADAGIRRLMLTVLEDGIRDFQRYRNNASTNHGRRIFWEAQRWIEAEGDLGPFCFDNLCETFNCDPQLSRERIYAGLLGILPRHHLTRAARSWGPAPVLFAEGVTARAARRTECPKGHSYTVENTYWYPSGKHRKCCICFKLRPTPERNEVDSASNR